MDYFLPIDNMEPWMRLEVIVSFVEPADQRVPDHDVLHREVRAADWQDNIS